MRVTGRFALLAFAAVALALGNTSSSQANLVMSYTTPGIAGTPVTLTHTGTSTTITESPTPIAVTVVIPSSVVGTITAAFVGYEVFTGVTSSSPASFSGGSVSQYYSGEISFTTLPSGGQNILTAAFTNATLTGIYGTTTATLNAENAPGSGGFFSAPAQTLALSSSIIDLVSSNQSFSIYLTGMSPAFGLGPVGSPPYSVTSSSATSYGNFLSDDIPILARGTPEPATVVGAVMAGVVAIGAGLRRRKAKVA